MSAPDTAKSFDPTASEPSSAFEALRRAPVVRYAAIALCGIGLATAGSTALRLGQGWRQPVASAEKPAASKPASGAAQTADPLPPPVVVAPISSPAAPPAPAPSVRTEQAPQVAPLAPSGSEIAEARPVPPAAAATPQATAQPPGSVPARDAVRAPEAAPGQRASGTSDPGPARSTAAPPRSGSSPVARARADRPSAERAGQGGGAEPARERSRPEERRARRFAADPARAPAPSQFREAAAPAGTAPSVRAYSLASDPGRTVDSTGMRIQVVRVR